MESDTKFSSFRHARDVHERLKSSDGLPFQEILSSEKISAGILRRAISFRKRFFLRISRSGRSFPKSSMRISLARELSLASSLFL